MKIYVAAKFEDAPRVREVYAILRAHNIEITHDWTGEDIAKAQGPDGRAYKRACATGDLNGVMTADAVLVLNHPLLYGGAAEMGMALAVGIKVFVVGAERRENIFFNLEPERIELCRDVAHAVERLLEYQKALGL